MLTESRLFSNLVILNIMTNFIFGSYPTTRLRRNRKSLWIRELTAQTTLLPSDLILPLFVIEGKNKEEKIIHLPGVSRLSIDLIVKKAKEAKSLGIPALMLFPVIDQKLKTADGKEAWNKKNLICRAIREIKNAVPEIGVICDVALDPYTTHGHDGIIADCRMNKNLSGNQQGVPHKRGARHVAREDKNHRNENDYVLNDATIEILCNQALIQAEAGCDIIAPSDMMDGRIGVIRDALDDQAFEDVGIISYAVKYASSFYGPFRHAVGSAMNLKKSDKKTYQMDFRNSDEAMREIALDISEGADMIIIKPGLPYLDITREAAKNFAIPLISYQVSGEYAMLKFAAEKGAFDFDAAFYESLIAMKRAGSKAIITYGAIEMARNLAK